MSTANFSKVNANNYYVILDTFKDEDENGNEVERYKESWYYDELKDLITYGADEKFGGWDRIEGGDGNRNYYGTYICEKDTVWNTFGSKAPWFLEVGITPTIIMRSGYYSGATLDYELRITDSRSNEVKLSDYDDLGDLLNDMMDNLYELVEWHGHECGWTTGTFKMQRKNIERWLEAKILEVIDECEAICAANAEETLVCGGRFSNGEAIYYRADSLKGKVNNVEG